MGSEPRVRGAAGPRRGWPEKGPKCVFPLWEHEGGSQRRGTGSPRAQGQRAELGYQDSLGVTWSEWAGVSAAQPASSTASLWPACPRPPRTRGVHLARLARDVALGVWRRLTLDPGLHHHLPALQLHHTLVVSWAVLGAEDMVAGAASGAGPGEPRRAPSTVPGLGSRLEVTPPPPPRDLCSARRQSRRPLLPSLAAQTVKNLPALPPQQPPKDNSHGSALPRGRGPQQGPQGGQGRERAKARCCHRTHSNKHTQFTQDTAREARGFAPYERRARELLTVSKDKRALKLIKKRVGTCTRATMKRRAEQRPSRHEKSSSQEGLGPASLCTVNRSKIKKDLTATA